MLLTCYDWGSGSALAQPDWPGAKLTPGQGQGPAKMALTRPGPRTVYAKEAIWLRRFLTELFRSVDSPTILFSDSKSAIALANDGHYHAHTKHIDIWYHFIRYIIEAGLIKLVQQVTWQLTHLPRHCPLSRRNTLRWLWDWLWFEGECWKLWD